MTRTEDEGIDEERIIDIVTEAERQERFCN
jgi:hypothetical protein